MILKDDNIVDKTNVRFSANDYITTVETKPDRGQPNGIRGIWQTLQ